MAHITQIKARQILDSRGNPTIEADVWTNEATMGRAAVPSGASTGSREALELRDNNPNLFLGKSVYSAIDNIHRVIAPALKGISIGEQKQIDHTMIELDGTENKSKLGANAMLAVSLAAARAGANTSQKSLFQYLEKDLSVPQDATGSQLPLPLMNIINGGEHASNNLDLQEFMIVPMLSKRFSENLRAGVEVFHHLKSILKAKNHSTNVGDEGGFAPDLSSNDEAIELILEAIAKAGFRAGEDIKLSFDCAASEFYDRKAGLYRMNGKNYSSEELIAVYEDLCSKYPIYSVEDGLDESDYSNWSKMTKSLGDKTLLVGDDLFVTNATILKRGIEQQQANAILVKVNQIGTLSETLETMGLAFDNGFKAIISHRSGETADSFIADLCVATRAGLIKTGSASRTDRMEKYNQLLRIEEELGL